MSLDQEIVLLRNVATLRDITELSEYYDHLSDLLRKVQDQSRFGNLGQTLIVHPLAKYLFTALSIGLRALNRSIECKQAVNEPFLASIAKLEAVADVCMKYCTSQYPPDPAPIDALLVKLQQDVVHSGLLDSFAATCSAFAAALNDQIQQKTDASHPGAASHPQQMQSSTSAAAAAAAAERPATNAAAAAAVRAVLSLTEPLVLLWLKFELIIVYASTTPPATDDSTEETVLYRHFTAQFYSTIQPLCSWIMALLRHETNASDSASGVSKHSGSSSNQKDLITSQVAEVMQLVSRTVATEVKHLFYSNEENEDQTNVAEVSEDDAALKPMISQILQCPSFQQLQLLNLATLAGGMHKQQHGELPAELLEAAPNSQQQQKLKIADSSAMLLQELRLSTHQGQQYFALISDVERGLIDSYGCYDIIEATVRNLRRIYDSSSCIPAISSNSSDNNAVLLEAKLLPVLLQLAAQLPLLGRLVHLLTLMETICSKVRDCCRSSSSQDPSAVAAAVTELGDSILAPLMLQVGPAVLHVLHKPGDASSSDRRMKTATPIKWSAVVQLITALKVVQLTPERLLNWRDWDTWFEIVHQQPYTATAAAEVAVRAAAAADSQSSVITLLMTSCLFPAMTTSTRELMEAGPVTAHRRRSSSNSKRLHCFDSNSMAAKPFSLFVTGIKYVEQFAKTAESKETILAAFHCALDALVAAQRFGDAAAGTAEEGAYIASRTSGVAAIPWMHAASRVLHCCAQILLSLPAVDISASHGTISNAVTSARILVIRLIEPVRWCQELLILLVDASSYTGTGSSTCTREAPLAGVVSAKVVQKLQQQCRKTQLMLQQAHKGLSEVGELVPLGSAAFSMQWDEVGAICNKLSQQLQQYAGIVCAVFPTLLCCNNPGCSNMCGASELSCVGSSKCSRCKAAGYCSRECQAEHWSQHKMVCSKIAAE